MKKGLIIAITIMLILLAFSVASSTSSACRKRKESIEPSSEIEKDYGSLTLSGGIQAGHFNDTWNLTVGELKITFTFDGTGLVDVGFDPNTMIGTMAIGQLGIRDTSATDMAPFAAGIWLNTLYDITPNTFDPERSIDTDWDGIPDTKADNYFDPDDQLMLQKGGPNWNEQDYDLPSGQGNLIASHGIWFDRDGVNSTQEQWWGFEDGGVFNTDGTYDVELLLKATSDTTGEAYLTINGVQQGFWNSGWKDAEPEMYPAGMTFTGDMKNMQVFYSIFGVGAVHNISFNNIKVVQSVEYDLSVDIDVNVINGVINSNIIKSIPEDVKIKLKLKVKPKVRCNGDARIDIDVLIIVKENKKINVDLVMNTNISGSNDDASVDVDIIVKNAADVRINGSFNIENVDDDAKSDLLVKVIKSGNVKVNTNSDIHDIGDDAKVKSKIVVRRSLDVWIAVQSKVHDISEDTRIQIIIRVRKCNNVDLNVNILVNNVIDDSKIKIRGHIWKCEMVSKYVNVTASNIGDRSRIKKRIRIK